MKKWRGKEYKSINDVFREIKKEFDALENRIIRIEKKKEE